MRISDCSSDLCSSYLVAKPRRSARGFAFPTQVHPVGVNSAFQGFAVYGVHLNALTGVAQAHDAIARNRMAAFAQLQRYAGREAANGNGPEIGRASCRERVCQYV